MLSEGEAEVEAEAGMTGGGGGGIIWAEERLRKAAEAVVVEARACGDGGTELRSGMAGGIGIVRGCIGGLYLVLGSDCTVR